MLRVVVLRETVLRLRGARLVLVRRLKSYYTPEADDRIGTLFNDERPRGEFLTSPARSGTILTDKLRIGEVLGGPRIGDVWEVTE